MKSNAQQTELANRLFKAATDAARLDEAAALLAIKMLRRRHRRRPDVKAKLLSIAERKLEAAK